MTRRRLFVALATACLLTASACASSAETRLFSAARFFHTGGYPYYDYPVAIAIGDLNGDAVPDLALGNYDVSVSVLFGNGDGTFQAVQDFPVSANVPGIAVVDMNGDSKPDIVTANLSGSSVSVLLANGDGTFQPKQDMSTTPYPQSLAIGDLDGDGRLDAVVPGIYGQISVLLGNGNGTFHSAATITAAATRIAIADVNGDARADLLLADGTNTIRVLPGNGDGTFQPAIAFDMGSAAMDVEAADVNGDSKPDLVVGGAAVSILLGNGDGTFQPRLEFAGSGGSLQIGDIDADSKLDVVTGSVALLGNGDGTFQAPLSFGYVTAIADLNGDSRLDFVGPDNGGVHVMLGNGDGTARIARRFDAPLQSVAIADVNGDARADVVGVGYPQGVSLLLGNGDGTLDASHDVGLLTEPTALVVADMNRDSKPDLIAYSNTQNTVSVLFGNGDGTFQDALSYNGGSSPTDLAVGDLNGDSWPDVALPNTYATSVWFGAGDGSLSYRIDVPAGSTPRAVAIGDVDGDSRPDLIIGDTYPGMIWVVHNNGNGTFADPRAFPAGSNPKPIVIGDVNGDSKPDLVVGGGTLLLGNGDGTFQPGRPVGLDVRPFGSYVTNGDPAITDVNGDSKPDLIFNGRTIAVLLGNGDGTFQPAVEYGHQGGSIAVGDLNGDAKPDLVTLGAYVYLNISPGVPTATLISDFQGGASDDGIEVRWSMAARADLVDARLERGDAAAGPWTIVQGDRREQGLTTILIDRDVESGRTYFYRLGTVARDGGVTWFGPLALRAAQSRNEFALLAAGPIPSHGPVHVKFAVAREARVRIDLMDVQGRVVSPLVNEICRSGRHEVAWDGKGRNGARAAGMYFVRFEAAGVRSIRRLVLD
jgi:uncharacterized protein YfaP (DUF2135 family)